MVLPVSDRFTKKQFTVYLIILLTLVLFMILFFLLKLCSCRRCKKEPKQENDIKLSEYLSQFKQMGAVEYNPRLYKKYERKIKILEAVLKDENGQ
mmetsp:Transcript_24277/g.18469  ORF Transcript_24277/g.18469 Transcript_24277/m.18469 type:complete len:95 (+) Transcript_24277:541-825(+)